MRRAARIVIVGAALLAGLVIFLTVAPRRDDPVCQGRRLSSWFYQYALSDNSRQVDGSFFDFQAARAR
ncbi:MAG: hypothetical protein HY735_23015 [Verrucomicrobia bacterium]|nr:hypothetical protein [Verrucomicrobiota bacterium]